MSSFILRPNDNWGSLVKQAGVVRTAAPVEEPAPEVPEMPEMLDGMPVAPGKKPMPDVPAPGIAAEPSTYLEKERKEVEHAKSIIMQIWGLLTEEAAEGGFDEVEVLLKAIKSLEDFVSVEESGSKPGKKKTADDMGRRPKKDPMDAEIEKAWYALASGVQVSIMDIPKIFADCRAAMQGGMSAEDAVKQAIVKYQKQASAADVCPRCHGKGFFNAEGDSAADGEECPSCEGSGKKTEKSKLWQTAQLRRKLAGKIKDYLIGIYDSLVVEQENLLGRSLTPEEDMAVWEDAQGIGAKRLKELPKEAPASPEGLPGESADAKKMPVEVEQKERGPVWEESFTPQWLTKTRSDEMAEKAKRQRMSALEMDPKELHTKFMDDIIGKMEEKLGRELTEQEVEMVGSKADVAVADYFAGLMDLGKDLAKEGPDVPEGAFEKSEPGEYRGQPGTFEGPGEGR